VRYAVVTLQDHEAWLANILTGWPFTASQPGNATNTSLSATTVTFSNILDTRRPRRPIPLR